MGHYDEQRERADDEALARRQAVEAANQGCGWRALSLGEYSTGCGKTWHCETGSTPDEAGNIYCFHCGKPVRDITTPEEYEAFEVAQ